MRYFQISPLAREPQLILHSIRRRLGLMRNLDFTNKADVAYHRLPESVGEEIIQWGGRCILQKEWHPMTRLLGRDFCEEDLRKASCHGPFRSAEVLTMDPKLVWEYGRLQGCVLNALRARPSDYPAVARHLSGEIETWRSANDNPNGLAWINAMEIAIRAVNVILADTMLRGELSRAIGLPNWDAWLWNHGCFIWKRLESYRVASNHYISNLLGLAYVAAVFPGSAVARRWASFAEREFEAALIAQTYTDGALYEASLPYHGLVTEMALLYLLLGKKGSPHLIERISRMTQILADTLDVSGDVFPVGDDDGGRVVGMDFIVEKGGRAGTILCLAESVLGRPIIARSQASFLEAGWWVRRNDGWIVFFEYGPVGMNGCGSHAHNDDLSFSLSVDGHRLLVDPGSYVYTADLVLRNRYRSTLSHNVLIINGQEQRPLPTTSGGAFQLLENRCQTRLLTDNDDSVSAERMCRDRFNKEVGSSREIVVKPGAVTITDRVQVSGLSQLTWRFHFAPECQVRLKDGVITVKTGVHAYQLSCSGEPALELLNYEYSSGYGQKKWSSVLVATQSVSVPFSITWTVLKGEPAEVGCMDYV